MMPTVPSDKSDVCKYFKLCMKVLWENYLQFESQPRLCTFVWLVNKQHQRFIFKGITSPCVMKGKIDGDAIGLRGY